MPIRRAVLMIRQAISPRLAIKIRLNMPFGDPNPSRPHGFAALSPKSQSKPWCAAMLQFSRLGRISAGAVDLQPNPSLARGKDVPTPQNDGPGDRADWDPSR